MEKAPEHEPRDMRELIYRGVESEELDYKAAMSWTAMSRAARAKIVRHCLALANTKGGYIVIGVRWPTPKAATSSSASARMLPATLRSTRG